MLEAKIQEIEMTDGKVAGVKFLDQAGEAQHVKCKQVICDPSYVPDKVRKVGQVIRVICLLNHPVPNTDEADSVQIIIPQSQVGRRHDIYIAVVGFEHRVAGKGWYIAMVSTIVETNQPGKEVDAAMQLLGPVVDRFVFHMGITNFW
jgi:Rab GDP dissociation inhibitor